MDSKMIDFALPVSYMLKTGFKIIPVIVVAQWLVHLPLVLEVPGRYPLVARKISESEHAFSIVICS